MKARHPFLHLFSRCTMMLYAERGRAGARVISAKTRMLPI
jgi:hypothetical protein